MPSNHEVKGLPHALLIVDTHHAILVVDTHHVLLAVDTHHTLLVVYTQNALVVVDTHHALLVVDTHHALLVDDTHTAHGLMANDVLLIPSFICFHSVRSNPRIVSSNIAMYIYVCCLLRRRMKVLAS